MLHIKSSMNPTIKYSILILMLNKRTLNYFKCIAVFIQFVQMKQPLNWNKIDKNEKSIFFLEQNIFNQI